MKASEAFELAKNFNLVNAKLNDIYARIKDVARWGGFQIVASASSYEDREVLEILQSDGYKLSGMPNRLVSWDLKDEENS
jgi:hypothetical protein